MWGCPTALRALQEQLKCGKGIDESKDEKIDESKNDDVDELMLSQSQSQL